MCAKLPKWDNPSIFIMELLPFFCQNFFGGAKCRHASHMLRAREILVIDIVSHGLSSPMLIYMGRLSVTCSSLNNFFFKALAFRAGDLDKTIGPPWISLDLSIFSKSNMNMS